ncbi:hypothetical protein MMC25_001987 [Agyrium rufum]|nr:hypothetical protein [Agyrium rufum]
MAGVLKTHHHHHLHHQPRNAEPVLDTQAQSIEELVARSLPSSPDLTRRDDPATTTKTVDCAQTSNAKNSACYYGGPNTTTNTTIPIVLGVVIPLISAFLLLIYLHRRHVNRLKREDAIDKSNALDFGMGSGSMKKNSGGKGGVTVSEKELEKSLRGGRGRGLSMDMVEGNPFLLPPGLHNSRESVHSLSRAMHAREDPYRHAISNNLPGQKPSRPMASHSIKDDSSSHTASSGGYGQDSMSQNLVRNAQKMSESTPHVHSPRSASMSPTGQYRSPPPPPPVAAVIRNEVTPKSPERSRSPKPNHDSYGSNYSNNDFDNSNNYHGSFIQTGQPTTSQQSLNNRRSSGDDGSANPSLRVTPEQTLQPLMRKQSLPAQARSAMDQPIYELGEDNHAQYYEDAPNYDHQEFIEHAHAEPYELPTQEYQPAAPVPRRAPLGRGLGIEGHRMSIMRPLPPHDFNDNPEDRASRIRSFYKEYFDESKPAKTFAPAPETYYEDYGEEYQGDGTVFDAATGQFVVAQAPYAEPVTRRAMTPPPRAPPRFRPGPGAPRHVATPSGGGRSLPGNRTRAHSSASARYGRGPQARPPPMPEALITLPTPHLLAKADVLSIPMDFAPPTTYRDRAAGRQANPKPELRPYSPAVPAHTPLASAFEELPYMPSPHHLRKSGLFTALDFAPPPRFKDREGSSDAGSIRSGRSNASARSAAQVYNIRTGAYRVSRIPKEMVGTKTDWQDSLKPTWGMRPHDA